MSLEIPLNTPSESQRYSSGMIEIAQFRTEEAADEFLRELKELIRQAFGTKFSDDDWQHGLGGVHIAVRDSGILVSHAAIVPRRLYIGEKVFNGGYVESVATLPDRQYQGLGSMAMVEAGSVIANQFEIGALSSSSKDFYRKVGWEDWEGPSYVLMNNDWVRSESEDDGIMVLRVGLSSKLDRESRIACEERTGDSW
jgi:aminoglycoside 2'-N-acetyltransferase I